MRQSGGHRIHRNAAGVRITVPVHAGDVLHPKIVRDIVEAADLGAEDL